MFKFKSSLVIFCALQSVLRDSAFSPCHSIERKPQGNYSVRVLGQDCLLSRVSVHTFFKLVADPLFEPVALHHVEADEQLAFRPWQ